jgi:ABC-type multidrug transport system fused ATPase/permease subunit
MIIISHRLSTVQYADKIYYLNEGEIVEAGTHDALINQRGAYYSMYEKQAESYRL